METLRGYEARQLVSKTSADQTVASLTLVLSAPGSEAFRRCNGLLIRGAGFNSLPTHSRACSKTGSMHSTLNREIAGSTPARRNNSERSAQWHVHHAMRSIASKPCHRGARSPWEREVDGSIPSVLTCPVVQRVARSTLDRKICVRIAAGQPIGLERGLVSP